MSEPRTLEDLLAQMPGLRLVSDDEAEDDRRQARAAERQRRLDALALPVTAADERLLLTDALRADVSRALPAVRSWLASPDSPPWIVLCGSVGRGKTLAAAWALLEHGGRYVGARELERLRMAAFGPELARFEQLLSGRLVVIDDLGREDSAERMTSALLDAVDARRRAKTRTIAIANLSRKQLEARYADDRLWSRLHECARFVADAGDDLRRRAAP
jgi:DNA replication protein DnaC